ncbi:MAG: transposase [Bryobacterales bacterium]|nr:transposase [Bryobacterales bacterium]
MKRQRNRIELTGIAHVRNRSRGRPLFEFLAPIRKVIDTTSAVESLNISLRRKIKTRGASPSEEGAIKLRYPALLEEARKIATHREPVQGAQPLHAAAGRTY